MREAERRPGESVGRGEEEQGQREKGRVPALLPSGRSLQMAALPWHPGPLGVTLLPALIRSASSPERSHYFISHVYI